MGLNTLIITDLDAVDKSKHEKAVPQKGSDLITANNALKEWHPKKTQLDDLLVFPEEEKQKSYDDLFSVRVAYQTPLQITLDGGNVSSVAHPRTFEDALVLENLELFRTAEGSGLVKKFKDAIATSNNISELQGGLSKALEKATKAEFALDMLYYKDPESIQVPQYIRIGLEWLENILLQRQQEVLVTAGENGGTTEEGST